MNNKITENFTKFFTDIAQKSEKEIETIEFAQCETMQSYNPDFCPLHK